MCVICHRHLLKAELDRYVGKEKDLTGKIQSRGFYICHDQKCKEKAIKARKIIE